jgi:mono/diheme cytochrome c family protein
MTFVRFTLALCVCVPGVAHAAEPVDYRKEVKPILQERCYACHGALAQKGKLRVDSGAFLLKAQAIIPGKPGESELVLRIASDNEATRMPPEGLPLKPEQIAKIKAWIEQGAKVPADDAPEPDPRDHWSFRTPQRPNASIPANQNAIDYFLQLKRTEKALPPVPPADKRVLLRRVYIDLIGIPPTAEETAAFVNDTALDAYDKVVEKLLASPQYGERWGRHFLDIWRYSDWWGLGAELRNSQRHIWHWRDWTIESFNADLGYDEMIRQMLAADELYPTDSTKLRATGYLARSYFLFNRTSWLDEVVEHSGKGFLGLTFNCAKCHDHKYDPIKQSDYYQLRAIFEPYQLRTDLIPGEPDATKNGIPRAFDCNLDAKTPFHIRGDERNPDKDRVIAPGLPKFLAPNGLTVTPVKLPPLAYRPGARPEFVAAYRKLAEAKLATAKAAHATAIAERDKLGKAPQDTPKQPNAPTEGKLIFKDDFAKPNPDLWEAGPGMWKHENGKLLQQKTGDGRSHLRAKTAPPADFEAKFNFTITGGDPYKSVGISFDVADANDVLVYVSAGGNKLQIAHKDGADYKYPTESALTKAIPLNKPIELLVRVRGTLVNVSLNGEHAIAYTLPVARKAGKLELITFTASAEFTGFALRELPKDFALVQPGKGAPKIALTPQAAEANVAVAERAVALAEAELLALEARAKADSTVNKDDAKAAAKAEKLAALRNAEHALAVAQAELLRAVPTTKAASEQKVKTAEANVANAKKAAENPGETYTAIPGAVKSAESNVESAASKARPFPDTSTGRRSAFANWIADSKNPLTARVAVNHIWLRHFGQPLVPQIFEFGRKGAAPTHPELLDWLACEFTEKKWSFKHIHKLIVTSNAYRLSSSSANADASLKIDPENRYYWRMNATRMDANAIRDSLLHLAGELDLTLSGPPVPAAQQETSRRRSLYFFHSHNEHNKLLDIFDNANVLECYRRSESIVPQQALALWNSKLAQSMAAKINDRLHTRLKDADDSALTNAAFETVLGTLPTKDELAICLEALTELRASLKTVPEPDRTKRARLQLVQALLNHNDFVTVR